MLASSARLLRLLALFQAQRYWSGAALARRLEIAERTLRRDVDKLRSLGYPVHSNAGAAGGYQLGAGANLPPLLLDDQEAVAVAIGMRTAAASTVAGIEDAALRVLSKLEQMLPARLRLQVSALSSAILPLGSSGPAVDADTLAALATAGRDRRGVRFEYQARDGESSLRSVEPHRLVHTGRRWYLVAWDQQREDWRTFRVDRILPPLSIGSSFAPRPAPDGDFEKFVSRSVGYAPYPCQARVVVYAPAAALAERLPPAVGLIEPLDETTCLLSTGATSMEFLAIHLALIGFEIEVRDPPQLIDRLRHIGLRCAAAAARVPPSL